MALDVSSISSTPPATAEVAKRAIAAQNAAEAASQAAAHEAAAHAGAVAAGLQPLDAPSRKVTNPELESMIRDMEKVSAAFNRRLSFSVNDKLGQVVVKVVDADTDKVVRELPPAELQHVYERIREVIGLLFDKKA